MASKKPKSELVAICKLEFYRKQKNWKFCSEERGPNKEPKRKAKASKVKLNQTYSIEPGPEKTDSAETEKPEQGEDLNHRLETEEQADLNEAFVETGTASEIDEPTTPQTEDKPDVSLDAETDNKPSSSLDPPGSPYSPRWSIQHWAERCRLWNLEPSQDSLTGRNHLEPQTPQESKNHSNLETNHNNQDYHFQEYPDHNSNFYNESNYPIQNCPSQTYHNTRYIQESFNNNFGTNVLYYNRNLRRHTSDLPQNEVLNVDKLREWQVEHDWELCAGEGAAWVESNWPEGAAVEPEGAWGAGEEDAVDGAEGVLLRAGDWLRRDGLCEESRCDSLPSVASDEFVRGATLAPHSTQIDLLLCPEPPTALSGAALARAVARHSNALKQLLCEARRRNQSPQLPEQLHSYDEVPVRDPGPAGAVFHYCNPVFNDPIVAGSFNRPDLQGHTDVGRGRGRLKVIGIGMGRPYRL